MTLAEVEDVIEGFVRSALHAREGRLDGVEVHGAQGHLIGQFVSPFSNARTDEFGGSLENRLRFPRRIMQGIRERAGRDFIVGYRLGVEEFTPGGVTIEESKRIARILAEDGDRLPVLSQGNFNTLRRTRRRHYPLLTYLDLTPRSRQRPGGSRWWRARVRTDIGCNHCWGSSSKRGSGAR
jgi:2,4-dienoyl-CoA reductase-like NADH-dependent reductase (Old Yellow Enzyme family)